MSRRSSSDKNEYALMDEIERMVSDLEPRAQLRILKTVLDKLGLLGELQGSGGGREIARALAAAESAREEKRRRTVNYRSSLGTDVEYDMADADEAHDAAMEGVSRRRAGASDDEMIPGGRGGVFGR